MQQLKCWCWWARWNSAARNSHGSVCFTYPGWGSVLKDVSVYVPKGSTVALIGRSGCGKSAVASLLMRFSGPQAGKISLEGRSYNTPMGEMGARLSGGERQRVDIARFLLTRPDVVMDEPTRNLDTLNEKGLLATLEREYENKMLIMVSHRLSTMAGCSRIFKLEDGRLTEM